MCSLFVSICAIFINIGIVVVLDAAVADDAVDVAAVFALWIR